MKLNTLILCLSLILSLQAAMAQEDGGRRGPPPGGGHRGMPPELRAQLTADQISQLEKATSMEDRMALLKSWGIKPPQREHRGPPPAAPSDSSSSSSSTSDSGGAQ